MNAIWIIFLGAIGACVGSFLNVVIYRLPRGESIVFPGSHCPKCGRAIRWCDNLPLLSWFLLRGRCRQCSASISPQYLLVEAATAAVVVGLYVCYYPLEIREGLGPFSESWPTFAAHAALLCGLLVCAVVDIEHWIVPLEVCWVVSLIGLVSAAAAANADILPAIPAAAGAASIGAAVGLAGALIMVRYGLIRQSFIDAHDKPITTADKDADRTKIVGVAISKQHGVSPRKEILHELLFLAPALVGAAAAYWLVSAIPSLGAAWDKLASPAAAGPYARHVNALLAALLGYLVGGALIWGTRIFGTLGFGKEAMGLGDVHILAAVGATTGWMVPTVVFFVAPFFALLWALYLFTMRKQRELPYGPWLAVATLIVILLYDGIREFLNQYFATLGAAPG